MKKNNKWLVSIFTIFVLFFVSCNNFLNKETIKEDLNKADAEKTARLYFTVNGSSARNILPDTSLDNFTDFELTGVLDQSGTSIELGTWNNIQAMLNDSISIQPGEWNLYLVANKGSITFSASTQVTVSAGESATASFKLRASDSDPGIADITLRYPANSDITKVEWYFERIDNTVSYLSNINSSSGCVAEGSCYLTSPASNLENGIISQKLTDSGFSLKQEIPAGKYIFSCEFEIKYAEGDGGYATFGEYTDYIVIERGLESKLDYTIDYFEMTGITAAESTQEGMVLTLDVPKGVEDILIMRVKNINNNMNIHSEEEAVPLYTVLKKKFSSPTTSHTTITLTDPYGYSVGDTLSYAVYFDLNSFSSVLKTFTAQYDGLDMPCLTTYPEFSTETDDNGLTTKIKITKDPVIDWKGHSDNQNYELRLGFDQKELFIENTYVFDNNTKECVVPADLYPGKNRFMDYRLCFDNDGWTYNTSIDTNVLSGAQLPPELQGPAPAVATEDGILIRVYTDNNSVDIKRSSSEEGPYLLIKEDVDSDEGYCEYLDKVDLVAGTTYYYKVVKSRTYNNQEITYGGEYFSATSIISKGAPVQMTLAPTLTLSNETIATLTSGTFTYDENELSDLRSIVTVFSFVNETDPARKIQIRREKCKSGYWDEELGSYVNGWIEYNPSVCFDKGNSSYTTNGFDSSIDLYNSDFDGEKFIFEASYVQFYKNYDDCFYTLAFTPQAGECPSEIQMPCRLIQLTATPTDQGILLTVSNISENMTFIEIDTYNSLDDYSYQTLYRTKNITSNTLSFTDTYVNAGKQYIYTAQAGFGTESKKAVVTATGGLGEPFITAAAVSTGVKLDFSVIEGASQSISRKRENNAAVLTPLPDKTSITDRYVNSEQTYTYDLQLSFSDENYTWYYKPHSDSTIVVTTAGSGEPQIKKLPTGVFDTENKVMTFTSAARVTTNGVNSNDISIDFYYDYFIDASTSITNLVTYNGSSMTYSVPGWGSGSYYLQEDVSLHISTSSFAYTSNVNIHGLNTEEMPAYIVIE